jgi:hypothetical protein
MTNGAVITIKTDPMTALVISQIPSGTISLDATGWTLRKVTLFIEPSIATQHILTHCNIGIAFLPNNERRFFS